MTQPLISAVVCTRNRAKFLDKCIKSIIDQTLSRSLYEILIVDNGSTDGTKGIVEKYKADGVRYLSEPVIGLSKARNTAWQNTSARYLGYLDDDAWADRQWLETALWSFQHVSPSPEWVGGRIYLGWESMPPAWIVGSEQLKAPLGFLDYGDKPHFLEQGQRLGGGNSFYTRSVLERIGGFAETLGRKKSVLLSGEEVELQQRYESDGNKLFYHPDISMHHYVGAERMKPEWFYKRFFWGGVSDVVMNSLSRGAEAARTSPKAGPQGGAAGRLLLNLARALGFSSDVGITVHARTYLCYVAGYLYGVMVYRD